MNDNKDRKYWFKRRRYGYGWTPITWRGWLTLLVFIGVVVLGAVAIMEDTPRNTITPESFVFLAFMSIATAIAVVVSRAKGPKPKWRWGSKSIDNPDEDI